MTYDDALAAMQHALGVFDLLCETQDVAPTVEIRFGAGPFRLARSGLHATYIPEGNVFRVHRVGTGLWERVGFVQGVLTPEQAKAVHDLLLLGGVRRVWSYDGILSTYNIQQGRWRTTTGFSARTRGVNPERDTEALQQVLSGQDRSLVSVWPLRNALFTQSWRVQQIEMARANARLERGGQAQATATLSVEHSATPDYLRGGYLDPVES